MGKRSAPARHRAEPAQRQNSPGAHRGERRKGATSSFKAGVLPPLVIGLGLATSAAAAVGAADHGSADAATFASTLATQAAPSTSTPAQRPREVSRQSDRLRVAEPVTIEPRPVDQKPVEPQPVEPAWLRACEGTSTSLNFSNGRIPTAALCDLPVGNGHHLRIDAAEAYADLEAAYRQRFGDSVCVTDSYRSLDAQHRLAAAKPGLAARPGTSNHGWGTALDLCGGVESGRSDEYEWFLANAPRFGWQIPSWARPGGSKPEPWHWEYGDT